MRKIIYGISSVFLIIGVIFIFSAGISFFVNDDPYNLSEAEFVKIYNDKSAYSYTYFNKKNDVIFICLDKNVNKKEDTRRPLCKGNRRYVEVSQLDKTLAKEILKEMNKSSR